MVKELLAQIRGPGAKAFTAGIVLWNDKVVETAPILGYMKGWTRDRVREYCERRNWSVRVVQQIERTDINPKGSLTTLQLLAYGQKVTQEHGDEEFGSSDRVGDVRVRRDLDGKSGDGVR